MLTKDLFLDYHNVHSKRARIHETLEYRAKDRTLVRTCRIARARFFGLLPMKQTQTVSVLEVPADITTQEQLSEFITRSKFWRGTL